MISEDLLERGFGAAGDAYDVPVNGAADILDQLRPSAPADDAGYGEDRAGWWRRPSRTAWLSGAAAAVVVVVGVAFAVGGSGDGSGGKAVQVRNATAVPSGGTFAGKAPAGAPRTVTSVPGSLAGAAVPSLSETDHLAAGAGVSAPENTPTIVPKDSLTKIEQTGEIDLQVDRSKVKETVTRISELADRFGGSLADLQMAEGDEASGTVTLRIPVAEFGRALKAAASYGKVLSSESKAVDVTSTYVDEQARLKSLQASRQVYLRILSRANTIGEILSVQQQINGIQSQIEQLQGQLKVLTERTSYSTLTVNVDQKTAPAPAAHRQSGLGKAVHRSVSRFVHGIEAIIGAIGPILLVVLLIGLGWLLARVGYRLVRRQLV